MKLVSSIDNTVRTTTEQNESIISNRIANGVGVIWSTHDRDQAQRVASRLFTMSGGRIKEQPL